jgi:hypothetical protein
LTHLEHITLLTIDSIEKHVSKDALKEKVQENNEATRIQTILVSKIFAEMMATVEDLGALALAIRQRHKGGIFRQYLDSKTADVANFFDNVKSDSSDHPLITLDILLKLPKLADLKVQVPDDILKDLDNNYTERAKHLLAVAKIYRDVVSNLTLQNRPTQPASQASGDHDITIMLGLVNSVKPARLYVDAFNKIKHRFMAVEDPSQYDDATSQERLEFVLLPDEPKAVDVFIKATTEAAKSMMELASLVLYLDILGVPV